MPLTIGSKESTFGDPIGLLSDCHRRIERFLQILQKIIDEKVGRSLGGEYRRSLEAALKYFRDAAPKHTADEEKDLFPALRSAGRADVEQILTRIDGLENDHTRADKWHRECDEIGKRWLRDDHLCLRDTARFRTVLLSLARLYQSHIAIEEREIFPVAQTIFSDEEKAAIGRSMADRRGIAVVPEEPLAASAPYAAA
jgi:hemerythrin-like domain-containing protein